eukprot:scaffold78525_cov62-Cyclotella_meneghiniana.AAC.1
MKLSTATAIINISSTLVYAKTSKSAKTEAAKKISGVDDLEGYAMVAKKFIGVNPKNGDGSGFILRADNDIKGDVFPDATIVSNTGRNNMCTCDCVPGPDGIGCVGWAGIAFRYGSLLWKNPFEPSSWQGQMQAYQDAGNDVGLNFMGDDIRMRPGGSVIYNVACTDQSCSGLLSGVFRQSNSEVSCAAGLAEVGSTDETSCFMRCKNAQAYTDWLAYCAADEEDESLGFSGHGM